ncbi:Ornithine carbamoyltransferase 2 [Staphylococcus aureus]|nr:Ornithine carbamoyltransferase 2 [Staphylococcus aureus]
MTEIQKPYDLKGRSLLKESDFTKAEFEGLIDFAITLKEYKKNGIKHHYLSGKNIALLFEKNSTRTRAAFTVASIDLGVQILTLTPNIAPATINECAILLRPSPT